MMATPQGSFYPEFADPVGWARMYREAGLNVIPAYFPGEPKGGQWKRPCVPTWREFENDRTTDLQHDRWYGENGAYRTRPQMGVITGLGSDQAFIIDLDISKGPKADQWWHGLLAVENNGIEPETPHQVTGGGGRQLLFRAPLGWRPPTNKTTLNVDIRGQGGFAMLPPSKHESGNEYEWAAGYEPWNIEIATAPGWLVEAIDRLVAEHGGGDPERVNGAHERTSSPEHPVDAWGNEIDWREQTMRDFVWASVVDWYRECPIKPPESEWPERMEATYEAYERKVGSRLAGPDKRANLEREGRGPSEFKRKWRAAMRQWDTKVWESSKQPPPKPEPEPSFTEKVEAARPDGTFEFLDVKAIKTLPDPQWLVQGLVTEQALGFIFGPPGSGKSFVALSMALSMSVAMPDWWGRAIERSGAVVYVSSEGQADLKFRIAAWEHHNQVLADDAPFYLVRQSINFMNPEDVAKLVATVEAVRVTAGTEIVAVFVDTVSRVLPGADENLQKDMTLFVAACDAVRERFGATVVGVHHTSRNGNLRGSTVFDGAGDFLAQIEREEGASIGTLTARKIKAAADGWSEKFSLPVVTLPFGKTSLVAVPVNETAAPEAPSAGSKLPSRHTCNEILKAMGKAWSDGHPWSNQPNVKRLLYAPRVMVRQFGVADMATAEKLLDDWLYGTEQLVRVATRDIHNRVTGLEVRGYLD